MIKWKKEQSLIWCVRKECEDAVETLVQETAAKKKRLVMAAAVAVAIPVVLAVLFDWRIGSIQLRYVFCGLGTVALFGWFCVFGIRDEISQMNKERGCTQAVEATVTGYQQKRVAEPDSGGNMIIYQQYGPCFSYVYQGRRSYCLWKYNRFTLKRMLRAYPVARRLRCTFIRTAPISFRSNAA